jgi:hypothetical protein
MDATSPEIIAADGEEQKNDKHATGLEIKKEANQ